MADPKPVSRLGLRSPNGRIQAVIQAAPNGPWTFSVAFDRKPLIVPSPLGLRLDNGQTLSHGLRITRIIESRVDRYYPLIVGKTRNARDHFNQLKLDLEEATHPHRQLQLIFRAYDDGVAFRYRVRARTPREVIRIADELTRFCFAADHTCWALNLGAFDTGHEGEFHPMPVSAIGEGDLIDVPLVCQTDGVAFAIAEADLKDYAGLYLRGCGDGTPGVQVRLSLRPDDPTIAVQGHPGSDVLSPWRVLMIADEPGDLIQSTLITSLNPPNRIADTSWIKPGKYAWDWWCGGVASGTEPGGMTNATITRFIDFAEKFSLPYMMIDAGWYVSPNGDVASPEADVTCSIPDIDLPYLVDYARQRNVGLFVWAHWKPFNAQLDAALTLYQQLGLQGIKIDFMDRNDQEMVDFYHRVLAKAAEHRLLVDLHGAYPPTGLSRTWPNLLTQEGVMGAEYNKWSARVTATHNVTLPFTRMLLGPMDYTPGGFRHVTPTEFVARDTLPLVQTTRGHALAMYVVFDSPLVSLADAPDAYVGAPGANFLRAVPTTWDETRCLAGQIGQFVVIARRSGDDWYVGAITNEAARALEVPLDFLRAGRFTARTYADGATPTTLTVTESSVGRDDTIQLRLAPSGGGVIAIKRFARQDSPTEH